MEDKSEPTKCVIVIANDIGLALMVNAAAVLALSIGRRMDSIVGPHVMDLSGGSHAGLTSAPLPILTSNRLSSKELRANAEEMKDLTIITLFDTDQCHGEFA